MATADEIAPQEVLDSLDENAANEQVEQLVALLSYSHHRQCWLEDRLDHALDRIDDLESELDRLQADPDVDVGASFDSRDQKVLQALKREDPDEVTPSKLQSLYRRHTDVRRKYTLKQRIKTLTDDGPFEYQGSQTWTYKG